MLHLPELDVAFQCRDGDVVYFAGWQYLHGVTPVTVLAKDSYRITAVFYAIQQMTKCGSAAAELEHAQKARTDREADLRSGSERVQGTGYLNRPGGGTPLVKNRLPQQSPKP